MGYRLSKIYTRTGDKGTTGLATGDRVAKDHIRIETLGTVDELLSSLGLLIAMLPNEPDLTEVLQEIQHRLFDLGSEIAVPGRHVITETLVSWLEVELDKKNESLPPLKEFILPGGSMAAAQCHMTRSVCRKLERRLITLTQFCADQKEPELNPFAAAYINRLSDLLFVFARVIARLEGGQEVLWQPISKPEPS